MTADIIPFPGPKSSALDDWIEQSFADMNEKRAVKGLRPLNARDVHALWKTFGSTSGDTRHSFLDYLLRYAG